MFTFDKSISSLSFRISAFIFMVAYSCCADAANSESYSILSRALKRAGEGGLAGATAMAINVITLMWIRTIINYQYRYGTSMVDAFLTLYKEGGIPRFYRGLIPALIQGPLSRFGDTAANTGALAVLDAFEITAQLPVFIKTAFASVAAALFRVVLMPIDTIKTTMQVEGRDGLTKLLAKFRVAGISTFYQGSLAAAAATYAGHYPWFFTYNFLDARLPRFKDPIRKLVRSAMIGFFASAVSDVVSNSIRVLKVYKQSSTEALTYSQCLAQILQEDGWAGLFGRGLVTKIVANGLQGIMFSILWKLIDDKFFKQREDDGDAKKDKAP